MNNSNIIHGIQRHGQIVVACDLIAKVWVGESDTWNVTVSKFGRET